MNKGKLGVIGGMGPQAMLQFCQRVIDRTRAAADQEHLPMLILNDTQMPDRTAAILSGDTGPVVERLLQNAKQLEDWGAGCIAIPCNTSHAFVPWLQEQIGIPIVNMIQETAGALKDMGAKRVGILGTDGTLRARLYHDALESRGMEALSPPAEAQRLVMDIIYQEIKKGERGSREKFAAVSRALRDLGCDRVVLACTEMSTYKDWHGLGEYYVDAMDVLARRCVELCGYPLREL